MKKLLPLILVCLLLCGCAAAPEVSEPNSEAAVFDFQDLPGDLTGPPMLSPDGNTLFYCTASHLRAWDLTTGVRRLVREMEDPVLADVLLDGTVLQCTAGEETLFLSAQDGQLLHRGRGRYQIRTEADRYYAQVPAGENQVSLWGVAGGEPMLLTAENASLPYSRQDLTALQREATALGDRYGITILLGEEAAAAAYGLTPETLEPVLRQGLDALEQALAAFPETMLRQTSGHFSGLTLCLVRSIEGNEEYRFLQDRQAYLVIALGPDLAQDLHHGLFHWMETHIFAESTAFDRWDSLNPAGFSYDYDFEANTARNSGVYLFGEHRAFVDTYSMSYPSEDRARILEYAMLPGQEAVFRPLAMQKKLQALCAGIREAFSLEDRADALLWEQYLD